MQGWNHTRCVKCVWGEWIPLWLCYKAALQDLKEKKHQREASCKLQCELGRKPLAQMRKSSKIKLLCVLFFFTESNHYVLVRYVQKRKSGSRLPFLYILDALRLLSILCFSDVSIDSNVPFHLGWIWLWSAYISSLCAVFPRRSEAVFFRGLWYRCCYLY